MNHIPLPGCPSQLSMTEFPLCVGATKNTAIPGEGAEKREHFYTVGGNVSWCSHCGKQYRFLRKLKIELPYDPAIPLLGIYPDKTIIQKDTFTPMFIAALFTIVKTWKQPKCPSTDEWIKKMWYIYNEILLSHKKEQNNAICSNMEETRGYHTK